jgi:hypothetical protein
MRHGRPPPRPPGRGRSTWWPAWSASRVPSHALAPVRPGLHRIGVVAGTGLGHLRSLHTGYVGDYVTWLVAGAALLGGLFALTLTT